MNFRLISMICNSTANEITPCNRFVYCKTDRPTGFSEQFIPPSRHRKEDAQPQDGANESDYKPLTN